MQSSKAAGRDESEVRLSPTMATVEEVIARHRSALTVHPFLRRLEGRGTLEELRKLLSCLGLFPLMFQDMLRVAHEQCVDLQLREIIGGLVRGDAGHEQWYLQDLERVGARLTLANVFSEAQWPVRRVAYSVLSRLELSGCDQTRLSILLSLEAAAHEFFSRVSLFSARSGFDGELKYFGGLHIAAEAAHEVFGNEGQAELATLCIPQDQVPEVVRAVEHAFATMAAFADLLLNAIEERSQ